MPRLGYHGELSNFHSFNKYHPLLPFPPQAGHSVRFGTHATFREFVEKFSSKIEFVDIGGNPQKMMVCLILFYLVNKRKTNEGQTGIYC